MTVMSEGLLLNSKYMKMGREERVFKLSSYNMLFVYDAAHSIDFISLYD